VLEEYFALGFRSPHRITYDATTNRIWLGDVGQSAREEVNIIEKGGNYQWGFMEGTLAGPSARPTTVIGVEAAAHQYPHKTATRRLLAVTSIAAWSTAANLTGKYLFRRQWHVPHPCDDLRRQFAAFHRGGSCARSRMADRKRQARSTFCGIDHNNEPLMCCVGIGVKIYKPGQGKQWR